MAVIPTHCPTCSQPLFHARPFTTTRAELRTFVASAIWLSDAERARLESAPWLHPGAYCRTCGVVALVEPGLVATPPLTPEAVGRIATGYAARHLTAFAHTHGEGSRLMVCVHCASFGGANVPGFAGLYRRAELKPLSITRVERAHCAVSEVNALDHAWWYDTGGSHACCAHVRVDRHFVTVFKAMTGWSEYR